MIYTEVQYQAIAIMFFKVFLLTVICTVTLIESRVVHAEQQTSVIKGLGEVEDELKDLEKKVHENIAEAEEELENIDEESNNVTEIIVQGIKKGLNNKVKHLLDDLNQLKEQAKQAGIDINDCLSGKEQTLINIPVNFGKKINHCQKNILAEFKKIVDYAVVSFQLANQKVEELFQKLSWCNSSYLPVQCRTGVSYAVYDAATDIFDEFERSITEARNFDNNFQTELKERGSKIVKQATTEGQENFSEIKQCIESKIRNF